MVQKPTPLKVTLLGAMSKLGKLQTKVGWFESAKYEDGTPVAYVAAIMEEGAASQSIPARPFFAPTVSERQASWAELMASGATAAVNGKVTAMQVMEGLGLQAEGDVRKTISEVTTPPLSIITLLARKHRKNGGKVTGKTIGEFDREANAGPADISGVSTKPLVDTGLMIATLTSATTEKGK